MSPRVLYALIACLLFAGPLSARAWEKGAIAMPDNPNAQCKMQETGQVGVNFNNVVVTDVAKVGPEMDRRIDEIIALARKAGVQQIQVQSYNYNVYPVSNAYAPGGTIPYQYNSSVSFSIEPCEKGSELMSLLAGKGYAANLNVNAYRQCQ